MTVVKKKPSKRSASKPVKVDVQSNIDKLIAQAINKKAYDTIDMLIGYDRELKLDLAKKTYLLEMREFQNELPDLPKTQEAVDKNGKKYKYSPLNLIKEIIQPFVFKYGFVYRWDFKNIGEKIECTCIVTHIGGYSETSSMTADRDDTEAMNNIQSIGSTRTYLMRYTLIAVFGLSTAEEDNDGYTSATKITSAIPEPHATSKEKDELEKLELDELMLKVDRAIVDDYLKEKYSEEKIKKFYFTALEKLEIKNFIINTILGKK